VAEDKTQAEIAKQAQALALAFDDPAALARRLGEWLRENYPERVAQAYWITASGGRDKGLQVEIVKLPLKFAQRLKLNLSALIGGKTAGAAITSEVWQDLSGRWSVLVGLGAVSRYADILDGGKWEPVATIAVKVRL